MVPKSVYFLSVSDEHTVCSVGRYTLTRNQHLKISPIVTVKADDDIRLKTVELVNILEEKYPGNSDPQPRTLHCVVLRNMRYKALPTFSSNEK